MGSEQFKDYHKLKFSGIYSILAPNGRIYIGKAVNIYNRWRYHRSSASKRQPKLFNSFQKYGVDNHIFKVEKGCPMEELNVWERFYQDKYDVLNREKGLNCVLTPSDELTPECSDETRQKLSESLKRAYTTGKRKSNKGYTPTEETRRRISEAHTGRKRPKEMGEKIALKKAKTYYLVNPLGEKVKIFNLSKYCRDNQLDKSRMEKVLVGKTSHHKGWTLDSGQELKPFNFPSYSFISPTGEIFEKISNICEFARTHNIDRSGIQRVSIGQLESSYGWRLYPLKEKIIPLDCTLIDPTGVIHKVYEVKQFLKEHGLNIIGYCRLRRGAATYYKGWKLYKEEKPEGN